MHCPLFIQLSDPHLLAARQGCLKEVNTYDTLRAVLKDAVKRFPLPDAYLLTGDLSQDGTAQSYENLKQLINELTVQPSFVIAGNHDDIDNMQRHLISGNIRFEPFMDLDKWRVIFLNTQVAGEEYGYLSQKEMDRFKGNVSEKAQHHLICIHHPPVLLDGFIDRSRLQNSEEFLSAVGNIEGQKVVIFGHAHQEYFERRDSILLLGAPSTCVQFKPHTAECVKDTLSPGYRVLTLYDKGDIETEVIRL